ncbi:MAG: isocitrate lyase/phosphoenolpyruvate mutase family protein [Legionellales bacterium]|nr:isocitrate lyase/phosphoenolpyruvate mutase family protein [Legionellales bacterium]
MNDKVNHAKHFHTLHIKGDPLILYNIWDAGSAKAIQEVGAKAIATSSFAVAATNGYEDGEKLPLACVLENIAHIIDNVTLPVTLDFEGGYARAPHDLYDNILRVIERGAVGINFEDQIIDGKGLYSITEQCARIHAVRQSALSQSFPLFINARTDIFLKADHEEHHTQHIDEALERAVAYAEAGANGFFAPGLRNEKLIALLCKYSPLPVNIMMQISMPTHKQLADLGVARISYGIYPYCQVMSLIKKSSMAVFFPSNGEVF